MSQDNAQPKIGIVSGIGPLAGSDVLRKVYKHAAFEYGAVEDAEYPDVVLMNHGISGVDNTGALSDEFETGIISMVRQLEANEATIVGIACNTAHAYLDRINVGKKTTLINLIDEVALEASKTKQKYLLLTSSMTKRQKLYHSYLDAYNVEFSETLPKQQVVLDKAIGLVMAYQLKESSELLDAVLSQASQQGYTAVIAGCTEIPIAIDNIERNHGLRTIDSNYVLAKSLVDSYYSRLRSLTSSLRDDYTPPEFT